MTEWKRLVGKPNRRGYVLQLEVSYLKGGPL